MSCYILGKLSAEIDREWMVTLGVVSSSVKGVGDFSHPKILSGVFTAQALLQNQLSLPARLTSLIPSYIEILAPPLREEVNGDLQRKGLSRDLPLN